MLLLPVPPVWDKTSRLLLVLLVLLDGLELLEPLPLLLVLLLAVGTTLSPLLLLREL